MLSALFPQAVAKTLRTHRVKYLFQVSDDGHPSALFFLFFLSITKVQENISLRKKLKVECFRETEE